MARCAGDGAFRPCSRLLRWLEIRPEELPTFGRGGRDLIEDVGVSPGSLPVNALYQASGSGSEGSPFSAASFRIRSRTTSQPVGIADDRDTPEPSSNA